uniref:Ig-like domain-containing protein n=1 Tax=Strongyloides venezuelensis TaxID=75913 RepID=A0A0K0FBP5_STRVS
MTNSPIGKLLFSTIFFLFQFTTILSLNIKSTINLGSLVKQYSDNDVAMLYKLKCQNQITPINSSIFWMYNNSEILPPNLNDKDKSTLLISNITERDTGLYDCCVLDVDNMYICYRQTLRVLYKAPVFAIDMRAKNSTIIQKNANVYLWLFNESFSNINCSFNEKILPSNVFTNIANLPTDISLEYKDMFINKTSLENTGNYSCIGSAINRRVTMSFYIHINSSSYIHKNILIISVTFFIVFFTHLIMQ